MQLGSPLSSKCFVNVVLQNDVAVPRCTPQMSIAKSRTARLHKCTSQIYTGLGVVRCWCSALLHWQHGGLATTWWWLLVDCCSVRLCRQLAAYLLFKPLRWPGWQIDSDDGSNRSLADGKLAPSTNVVLQPVERQLRSKSSFVLQFQDCPGI